METQTNTPKESGFKAYFSFNKMVALTFIKIMYVLGMIGSLLWMIYSYYAISNVSHAMTGFGGESAEMQALMNSMSESYKVPTSTYFLPILIFIGFNLIWRLICEGWIVLFKMNKTLDKIEKNTQK